MALLVKITRQPGVGEPVCRHIKNGKNQRLKEESSIFVREEEKEPVVRLPIHVLRIETGLRYHSTPCGPHVRFRKPFPYDYHKGCRQHRKEEARSPANGGIEKSSHKRREDDAERSAGLHEGCVPRPHFRRKSLANIRLPRRLFPADANPGDNAEQYKERKAWRETAKERANAVGKDSPLKNLSSPVAV